MAAPVAHFDEDWSGVARGSNMVSERELLPHKGRAAADNTASPITAGAAAGEAAAQRLLPHRDADLPGLLDGCFSPGDAAGDLGPTEELVSGFEDKLTACFHSLKAQTESIAPVSVISEDTLLETDEIWNALTCNYGNVMPVDWKSSRARSLHIPTFNPEDKPSRTDVSAELPDNEELREQLDMHSIIVSCLAEEPVYTAEQVIEEIEEMMQDSPDMETQRHCHHPSQSDLSMLLLDVQRSTSSPGFKDRVQMLSVAELNERLEETESSIRRFSEELVQRLALRDELDFEKEVKNTFISALIDVQNRQKEHRELLRRKKKLKGGAGPPQGHADKTSATSRFSMEGISSVIQNSFRQTFGSNCSERQYLTTVIPYEKRGHPPSLEDLQILTKILHAMREDSDKVPGLLTDYILKVLCPT